MPKNRGLKPPSKWKRFKNWLFRRKKSSSTTRIFNASCSGEIRGKKANLILEDDLLEESENNGI